jgi:hypothetical protein
MSWAGDENRIRALFSELSVEDQNCAPRFERLWRQAERSGQAQPRHFGSTAAVIILTAFIVVAAFALAVWSWSVVSINAPDQNAVNVVPRPRVTEPSPLPAVRPSDNPAPLAIRRRSHARRQRSFVKDRTTEASAIEAAMLSRWQSPTSILLASPTAVVLNSLPQVNESAEELKQFLPRKNDTMKESNQ